MSSLKSNVVLNFINIITGIIFPVITFPYASHILLPDGIGIVNFQLSIVNYVILFTSLGIPMYAVREVAKFRDNIELRNKITIEIFLLNLILCLLGYIIVWLISKFVPQIHAQSGLFYILSLTVLFTGIGVQWFYQGIEDFKFITIRAVIVRTVAALSLFFFVKEKSDLLIYGAVVVGSSVGNNLINFIHLRKYILLTNIKWNQLQVFKHLKPALHIFVLNLIISIYVNLNSVMLGFMQSDEAVGLYTAGMNLSHVVLTMVTSLGVVMIPRCSNLITTGKITEFALICNKAMHLMVALALPFTVGLMLLGIPIIQVFCGKEFIASVPVLYWTAPIIIFGGITNVVGLQILYPQNQENIVIWSTVGGAVINVVLNLFLIPRYAQMGAAMATFAAELVVLVIQFLVGYKYIPFKFIDKRYFSYITATILMGGIVCSIMVLTDIAWLQIILSLLLGGLVFAGYLFWQKDEIIRDVINYILPG